MAAFRRPLVVFTVYFGELPPWLPLTLRSMELNANVSFVVVSDAQPPTTLPPNVLFETIAWPAMQHRLSLLLTPGNASSVRYSGWYDARRAAEGGGGGKANDVKPLAAVLYPQHVAGHEWWAWSDLDVVFGDLLKFFRRAAERPACCRVPLRPNGEPKSTRAVNVYLHRAACPCPEGTRVNVMCPLYPNPWRKKAWGPFTAFRAAPLIPYAAVAVAAGAVAPPPTVEVRTSAKGAPVEAGALASASSASADGRSLFRQSPAWRAVMGSAEYAHFDEWWGPFHYSRGWETMGDVLTVSITKITSPTSPPPTPPSPAEMLTPSRPI